MVIFLDNQNRVLKHSRLFLVLLATLRCIREKLYAKPSK
jgi:DNA repair protein RadC